MKISLFDACKTNNLQAVSKAIERGERVDQTNGSRETPLHLAVKLRGGNQSAIITLLIEKSANLNALDNDGNTPLHYVNTVAVAEQLIKAGANPTITNNAGDKPSTNKETRVGVGKTLLEAEQKWEKNHKKSTSKSAPPQDAGKKTEGKAPERDLLKGSLLGGTATMGTGVLLFFGILAGKPFFEDKEELYWGAVATAVVVSLLVGAFVGYKVSKPSVVDTGVKVEK